LIEKVQKKTLAENVLLTFFCFKYVTNHYFYRPLKELITIFSSRIV
jgi:hypothetical protein